jgi:hypothetical protein
MLSRDGTIVPDRLHAATQAAVRTMDELLDIDTLLVARERRGI